MRVRQSTAVPATAVPATVFQHTLGCSVSLDGIGVHSGTPARLTLHPADADTGIVFHRTDLPRGGERFIPASIANVASSELATRIALPYAPRDGVGTVEHVLAALSALEVDNALVEIDGPEVPILDGSALPIVEAIDDARRVEQRRARRVLEILAPVRVCAGAAWAEFRPHANSLCFDVAIAYENALVGRQRRVCALDTGTFRREIAGARTFGFVADAERLWRAGLAKGSSFDNTIIVGDDRLLNPGPLRFPDEFVRHKVLDAIGDLALAGMPMNGVFRSVRGGHALNRAALAALLADRAAWRVVEGAGASGQPVRRGGRPHQSPDGAATGLRTAAQRATRSA